MEPPEGDWLTLADAARQLGLQPSSLRVAIQRGRLTVRKVGRRNLVSAQEVARYRREHLGRRSWQHRRDPDYQPSAEALWQRHYRERKRAHEQAQQTDSASTRPSQNGGGYDTQAASVPDRA